LKRNNNKRKIKKIRKLKNKVQHFKKRIKVFGTINIKTIFKKINAKVELIKKNPKLSKHICNIKNKTS
jgi:hypothetical protein